MHRRPEADLLPLDIEIEITLQNLRRTISVESRNMENQRDRLQAISEEEENNLKESSSYTKEGAKENTCSKGLILKELPEHLKYSFLQPERGKPVIISAELTEFEGQKLLETLRKYKETIAWSIEDLKGINPSICMHKIMIEENAKTSIEHQRRLNSVMKVVKK